MFSFFFFPPQAFYWLATCLCFFKLIREVYEGCKLLHQAVQIRETTCFLKTESIKHIYYSSGLASSKSLDISFKICNRIWAEILSCKFLAYLSRHRCFVNVFFINSTWLWHILLLHMPCAPTKTILSISSFKNKSHLFLKHCIYTH